MSAPESAAALYRAATDAGVRLAAADGNVAATATGPLSDQLRVRIKATKEELLRYLEKRCGKCGNPAYLSTYWGERLCQPCVQPTVELMDAENSWPEWPEKECK